MKRLSIPLLALAGIGCEGVDLERMIDQPSYRAYEESDVFGDGMAMREPPQGTIPRGRMLGPPEVVEGMVEGRYVETIPVPLDRVQLEHGRRRYEIFCAACHGLEGDGRSQVAENMTLRPPPSLVTPPISDYPPGKVFHTATVGYGLMPSYASELSAHDRWAVVGYLEVLQLRRGIPLSELPPDLHEEAKKWLP